MNSPTRRELLIGSAVLGASLCAPSIIRAQPAADQLRIGVIAPSSTGLIPVIFPGDDIVGDAVRQGALMANGPIGELAEQAGRRLVLMPTSAPTSSVVARAAERFVESNDVDAIVGGVGAGDAEVIAPIAEEAGIPFFNVGSPSMALRQQCLRYTFHIDASAAMYIDALVLLGASQGYRRWFIAHENTPAGEALRERAVLAVERLGGGGTVVGAAGSRPEEAFFGPQINAAVSAGADAILLLIGDIDQLVFIAQQSSLAVLIPSFPLPYPNTQTRQYLRDLRSLAPDTNPRSRVALWDTTLEAGGAGAFNQRYVTQWGQPADPPAWAAFHAIKILVDAVGVIGTTEAAALIEYFEDPATTFDVAKVTAASFRPWDHQLRQPLYEVRIDQEQEWDWEVAATQVALASVVSELPAAASGDDTARLDILGDGPTAGCER